MTRPAYYLLVLAATLVPACGQEDDSAADTTPPPPPPPPVAQEAAAENGQDALLQALFAAETAPALESAIMAARQGGVSDQALLEARFLFLVDQEDYAAIGALSPEFVKRRDRFRLDDSAIFALREDWEAVVEYSLALAALERNDPSAFKNHIKEAFWFSPRQSAAFAPHIERRRLEEAMEKVRIDFNQRLFTQDGRRPTSLAELAGDSRQVLLHFWSPWSEECEAYLPDFLTTANLLDQHGIKVISVLAELGADVVPDADAFRAAAAEKSPAAWIFENEKSPLGRLLRVQNLPTAVLVDRTGSILFNGHPADERLWTALTKAAPGMVRPNLPPVDLQDAPNPAE